jgi:hypothetical protein
MTFLKLGTSRHQLQAETASKIKAESKLKTYRRYGSFRIMGRCSLEEEKRREPLALASLIGNGARGLRHT